MYTIYILAQDATRRGGAGVYTMQLVKILSKRGHNVILICHEALDEIKNIATVIELPRINPHRPYGLWRFSSWLQIKDYVRLVEKLEMVAPDVIIGSAQPLILAFLKSFPFSRLIYLPHSLIAPIEIASYLHGGVIQKYASILAYWWMERKCFKLSAYTIRFSQSACELSLKYYGKNACGQLLALPMPMQLSTRNKQKVEFETVRLLFVGRLIPSKNVSFLLQALASINAQNWILDIVGDGDEKKNLVDYVNFNNLQKKVVFHGHVDDVEDLYLSADLFVFPSLLESYGIVLLEAMNYSLPTLSFLPDSKKYIGVSNEFIIDGEHGFLAKDNADFLRILENAINGLYDLQKMGSLARLSLQNKNGWESHAMKLEEIIGSINQI